MPCIEPLSGILSQIQLNPWDNLTCKKSIIKSFPASSKYPYFKISGKNENGIRSDPDSGKKLQSRERWYGSGIQFLSYFCQGLSKILRQIPNSV
jgi:hypothetical protein